jgi:hypothetical protein
MPILVKKIEGEILDNIECGVIYIKSIHCDAKKSDYINIPGFIGYLQDFINVESITPLDKPIKFGLSNNSEIITLEINY